MKPRAVLDVGHLPLHGMGTASLTWWGTLSFMLIEGTGFALVIGIYLYLESLAPECRSARRRRISDRGRL